MDEGNQMVTRVSEAIKRVYRVSTFVPIPDAAGVWEDMARAAIEIMLMPTPAMIDAGMDKAEAQGGTLKAVSPVWCAMITAALTPPPSGEM
jgi:hypothetical protein